MNIDRTYEELIIRLLDHSIEHDELEKLESWLDLDTNNQAVFDDYVRIWGQTENQAFPSSAEIEADLEQVHSRIGNKGRSIQSEPQGGRRIVLWMMSAAAALMLGYFGFQFLFSAPESIQHLNLADGSEVWLESESTLTTTEDFNVTSREVNLSGRAFFDVKRDEERPFVINTNNLQIEVLGTSFSIVDNESQASVEVASGKVSVKKHEWIDSTIVLIQGEKVELVEDSLIKGSTDKNAFAWKSKEISFQSENLKEVARVLSDVYAINISLADGISDNCAFTANFNNAELKDVLQVLSQSCKVKIRQTKGNYYTIE